MRSRIYSVLKCLSLALAVTLSAAMATRAHAASETPASAQAPVSGTVQQPVEELHQLSEIWVRGQRLASSIVDTENDFFRLYNKLNENKDFNITCGYASLTRGSLIMHRQCVPGFVADMADSWGSGLSIPSYATGTGSTCSGTSGAVSAYRDYSGGTYFMASCVGSWGPGYSSVQTPQPPAGLLVMERRREYADNVLKVINDNPELLQKYYHLIGLYHELNDIQYRYSEARAQKLASRIAAKPVRGPRYR